MIEGKKRKRSIMNGCPSGRRKHGVGKQKSSVGKFSSPGKNSMARQVTCVCGRDFQIGGHRQTRVQCRGCGRWYEGAELGAIEVVGTVLHGREVARIEHETGDRKVSRNNSHRRPQTNRQRPPCDPIGSIIRWFLG